MRSQGHLTKGAPPVDRPLVNRIGYFYLHSGSNIVCVLQNHYSRVPVRMHTPPMRRHEGDRMADDRSKDQLPRLTPEVHIRTKSEDCKQSVWRMRESVSPTLCSSAPTTRGLIRATQTRVLPHSRTSARVLVEVADNLHAPEGTRPPLHARELWNRPLTSALAQREKRCKSSVVFCD
jgi:hypothetical protein